jgi:hypothetical protein
MRALLLSGVAALLLVTGCGAGGPTVITGRIVDHKGTPITKAEVATDPETDVTMTNSRGFFSLRQRLGDAGESKPIEAGVYHIKVKKFGYEDITVEVKVEGGPTKVADIVLKPQTPDIGDTAPDPTQENEVAPDNMSTPVTGI